MTMSVQCACPEAGGSSALMHKAGINQVADSIGPIEIADLQVFVFRAPIAVPVRTSFGVMTDRPMLAVRLEDREGAVGWGEIWCNFPSCGAEHRARLVSTTIKQLLVGAQFPRPQEAFKALTMQTRVQALQSGESGPFAQCIAGIDIALWDLVSRRANMPLWRFLGGTQERIGIYASGLNPDAPERLAAEKRDEGYGAFKLKVGFGMDRDTANLRAMRRVLGDQAIIMVDANQAWDFETAVESARWLEPFHPAWLEEPFPADTPWETWTRLRTQTSIALAVGENVVGFDGFQRTIGSRAISVLQPDVAKWGGFSGGLPVAKAAMEAGLRFCPHYLGGGIGLLASAHFLAAAGGDGLLEVDANENVLRTLLLGPLLRPDGGRCTLSDAPGLGRHLDPSNLADYLTLRL